MSNLSLRLRIGEQGLTLHFANNNYAAFLSDTVDLDPSTPEVKTVPKHLSGRRVYIIDSINSGTGRIAPQTDIYLAILRPAFDYLHVNYKYIKTTSPTTICDFARTFEESDVTVIFISGDTSITEFVNALPESPSLRKLTLFPIPAGTGNSIALSLGYATVATSVRVLLSSHEEPLPLNLYLAKFPQLATSSIPSDPNNCELVFLVVLSWGFHAALVADSDTPEMRKLGLERFKVAAKMNLEKVQCYPGKTSVEGQTIDGPYAYWLVTLAQRFEPTFEILPHGSIKNDSLYLVLFNSEDGSESKYIMDIMMQVYDQGSHVKNPKVTYRQVRKTMKLLIDPTAAGSTHRFCLDGSIVSLPSSTGNQAIEISCIGNKFRSWSFYVVG